MLLLLESLQWTFPVITSQLHGSEAEGPKQTRISIDEDPDLRIESFAIIKIYGVSTNNKLCLSPCKPTKKTHMDTSL